MRPSRVGSAAAQDAGLVLLSCGVFSNVIRLLVPLTVSDDILALGLQRLEAALRAAARSEGGGNVRQAALVRCDEACESGACPGKQSSRPERSRARPHAT